MLSPYRVLDLTHEHGLLCGQILADLGADVIQVEPPDGSSARREGPWIDDPDDLEGSLFWLAYARGKRSIALDLESERGRAAFEKLVRGSDFLIESEPPGRLTELGYSAEALRALQPGLVHVSITPFGSDGPKADWVATDLTLMAAGGFAYLSGDGDRAPLRVSVPQAHAQAGADAAVGALIAHAERQRSGRGQHVDVSIQQSVTLATMFRSLDAPVGMAPAQRVAGGLQAGGVLLPIRHRTRDGWVTLGPSVLPSTGHFMKRLLDWVVEEGGCPPELAEENWGTFGLRIGARKIPEDAYEPVVAALDAFFATRSNAELMEQAVARRLLIAPTLGIDEIVESAQLRERGFSVSLEREPGGRARYPGAFARFAATPLRYRRPAPTLDEHGEALRAEEPRHPAPHRSESSSELPLAGIKILDLFWVLAGPTATRTLADYGATVVRVESRSRPDTLRVSPPWQFGQPHPEGAAGFQSANANKLGLSLDLQSDGGRAVFLDAVRWADVVTESFAPGVMAGLELDYEQLRAIKPDLIMLSSCIMGQTGPWRDYSGFGRLAVSIAGFQRLGSWPDRPPAGPFGAYTDAIASRYNAVSILAALDHRARTGEGQYIDLSQTEASLHFLAPAYLDWTLCGRVEEPCGNRHLRHRPHGVYPTRGEDRWIALAVRSDEEWTALCALMDREDLVGERDAFDRVEQALASWTSEQHAEAVEASLQGAGIPAHAVLDTPGLYVDAQLQHRGHFLEIEHEIYQTTTVESSRLILSRTPARLPKRALSLGRDNAYVLRELLGYSEERIEALAASGALE
jgi:crotonobetainyl-CoA:carnitine CoA-transferase CaiB-like acyl-CoA transferase